MNYTAGGGWSFPPWDGYCTSPYYPPLEWQGIGNLSECCSPSLTNTSWSVWADNSSCYINDSKRQVRNLTQYDNNSCGGSNTTFYQYNWTYCTYISNYTFQYYCPTEAYINIPFIVWVKDEANNTPITDSWVYVNDSIDIINLTYIPSFTRYQESFISNHTTIYNITIRVIGNGTPNYTAYCSIPIYSSFELNVRLWEQVDLRTYDNTSNYAVTEENYNKQLIDPYINDFAYIFAKSNNLNASGAYSRCYIPNKPLSDLTSLLNIANWADTNVTKNLSDGLVGCNDYWFRSVYYNGQANLILPYPDTYSLYLIEGQMEFENNVSPPHVTKGNMFLYLGDVDIIQTNNQTLDLWISHSELNFASDLSDTLFAIMLTIMPILLFIGLYMIGVPGKLILIILLIWQFSWLIKMFV
jgi:hypothetical protein